MKCDGVEILSKKLVYQGFAKVELYQLRHKLFAGGWSDEFERELLIRYNAVAVLPYDPKLDKVVLIEQFRIGALEEKNGPWLLELVAGILDKNKTEEETAKIETEEEAGLKVIDLIPIHSYWSSPGASSEHVTAYCAIVDAGKAGGIHGLDHEHEDILVRAMDSQEAFFAVRSGRINNASTIIALQWLELNLHKLKVKK